MAADGVARVRIGRIKLKAGGAELRVIERASETECQRRIRGWASDVLSAPDAPEAFFAIAFRLDSDCPGGVETVKEYWSDRHELLFDMMPDLALRCLRRDLAVNAAENRIMKRLDFWLDPEDDAS